ncbi:caspase family protein [Calothrix sp. UHCC 0171]|uniref:caspase family protein n=1 Tax=Calothrix sp. UHCC 0171 TaxID=3110245 RepID=UPI002B1F77C9|nr:caspase family protein [Calothrix sp. UHCC 0171]MEA5573811.1 caspase family protein [Calothrix sp. UHCC 0171]
MKRRTFLQQFGSILAIFKASEIGWLLPGSSDYQALAESNPRKLALLIGVNSYLKIPALTGCLTDVELQRELLIHRFGFQPSDILCLTDDAASRDLIEKAFFEHLASQCKPGDVVFFHFSGYGSRIKSENALIPVDGFANVENNQVANYLLEDTLLLMLRSLPTEKVFAVVDASYNAASTANLQNRGLAIRTHLTDANINIATSEIDLQKELKNKIATTPPALVVSATANAKQSAQEIQMTGFSAGIFTYALTQYLWENTPTTTINIGLARIENAIRQLGSNQTPNLFNAKKTSLRLNFSDTLLANSDIGVEGAVTAIEDTGKTVQLWLGGISPLILEYYGVNSRFRIIPSDNSHLQFSNLRSPINNSQDIIAQNRVSPEIVLRSRSGLIAKATILDTSFTPQVGQLIQEVVRVIPRNINLNIAIDNSLERIERVDATSGFATVNRVSSVVVGEQPADYIFGKLPETKTKDLLSQSRYGLFSLTGEFIPNTSGEVGEAAKLAAQRLNPKLQTLLAAKLWRITNNEASSQLSVKVALEATNSNTPQIIMQRETKPYRQSHSLSSISTGTHLQFRVENKTSQILYLMLFGVDSSKNPLALYSWQIHPLEKNTETTTSTTQPSLQNIIIEPGANITIPQITPSVEWVLQGVSELCETQVILSTAPFTQTIAALTTTKLTPVEQPRIMALANPSEVTLALLQDLHNASTSKKDISDVYMWDVNNWASFNFVYQVE